MLYIKTPRTKNEESGHIGHWIKQIAKLNLTPRQNDDRKPYPVQLIPGLTENNMQLGQENHRHHRR